MEHGYVGNGRDRSVQNDARRDVKVIDLAPRRYIRELRATKKICGPGWYADALDLLIQAIKERGRIF